MSCTSCSGKVNELRGAYEVRTKFEARFVRVTISFLSVWRAGVQRLPLVISSSRFYACDWLSLCFTGQSTEPAVAVADLAVLPFPEASSRFRSPPKYTATVIGGASGVGPSRSGLVLCQRYHRPR